MLEDATLNELFARSWPGHISRPFAGVLARSLGFIGAFDSGQLVGFVNVATDGGEMKESVPTPSLLSVMQSGCFGLLHRWRASLRCGRG